MFSFKQITQGFLHHSNTLLFVLIWITITAVAAVSTASALRRVVAPARQQTTKSTADIFLMWRNLRAHKTITALTLLGVFLGCYIALILIFEDFAYYDDSIFTQGTLKGFNISMSWFLNPGNGRFCPLCLQEFNLLRRFTDTNSGYHSLPIAQLLVLCAILLILDDERTITARATCLMLVLLTPSVLISFIGLEFPERDLLFLLTCLVLFVKRFEQTQSVSWAVAAVICSQIMIYSKETVFLLVFGFVATRIILRHRNMQSAGWRFDRLWVPETRLDLCLALLAGLFLILYLAFIGIPGNINTSYAAEARLPRADTVLGYTRVDLLPWLLLAVLLVRINLILCRRVAPLLLWDGLAFGGVIYFFAYLYLSMFGIYYLAPVDLIAVLYVGRFALLSWKDMRLWGKIAAALLGFVLLVQGVSTSALAVFERKNVIQAKRGIASVIKTQYQRGSKGDFRLFFPFAGGYELMEFGAYLNYRELPVEGAVDRGFGPSSVVLNRGRAGKDGPCVKWTSITCHFVGGPIPGDLVIVLPDDEASSAEATAYRERGELLFSYEHRPSIPYWLHWLFDNLHTGAQSRYRYNALPDRWMDGSVTVWK
jgi:hypothetical protein